MLQLTLFFKKVLTCHREPVINRVYKGNTMTDTMHTDLKQMFTKAFGEIGLDALKSMSMFPYSSKVSKQREEK